MNAVRLHRGFVAGVAADVKQSAVNFRMQRLHPAIEHFGKAGVFADVLHREARLAQGARRAAGGNQFHAGRGQRLGEGNQPGFVGNRKQRALNFCHIGGYNRHTSRRSQSTKTAELEQKETKVKCSVGACADSRASGSTSTSSDRTLPFVTFVSFRSGSDPSHCQNALASSGRSLQLYSPLMRG